MKIKLLLCLLIAIIFNLNRISAQVLNPIETKANKNSIKGTDQFIQDDLIVKEAIGFGDKMINGYDYGFNTFVLNDLDIRFLFNDDSGTGFPDNDWAFEINSSTSGGSSYFRINDVTTSGIPFNIQAGAPTNAFYIKRTTGFVGLGTSLPLAKLHITETENPVIRLHQNINYGWALYTWDVYCNNNYFAIKDVTTSKIPFKIEAGAPDNSMVLSSEGYIGIGTDSPEHKLEVKGDMQVSSLQIGDWELIKSVKELRFKGSSFSIRRN